MRVGEGLLYVLSAKGAQFNASWGSAPGFMRPKEMRQR